MVGWIAVGLIFFFYFLFLSYCHQVCLPANLIRHRDSCIDQLGCIHKSIILSLTHTHTQYHTYTYTHTISHTYIHTHTNSPSLPLPHPRFHYPTLASLSCLVLETLWGSLAVHKDACNTIKCNKLRKKSGTIRQRRNKICKVQESSVCQTSQEKTC